MNPRRHLPCSLALWALLALPSAAFAWTVPAAVQKNAQPITAAQAAAAHPGIGAKAVPGPGKGGVYAVQYFRVKPGRELPVFRVYSSSRAARARLGQWWTHNKPSTAQSRKDYQRHYAVCTDWNPEMDTLVSCRLKAGAIFALGPGESVSAGACAKKTEFYKRDLPGSYLQLFIIDAYRHPGLKCPGPASDDAFGAR